nr:hypothetical protein [Tanacetum cinerariifolium]
HRRLFTASPVLAAVESGFGIEFDSSGDKVEVLMCYNENIN